MPWTWLWVVVASRKTCIYQGCGSVLGALGPYLSLSAATWFPGPEDQLPPGDFLLLLQTCPHPRLGSLKAGLGSCDARVLNRPGRGTGEKLSPETVGEGAGKQSQLIFFPPWV